MRRPGSFPATFLLVSAMITLSCGRSRELQSVTISPRAADAKTFPNGEVPFVATGTFSKPPSPATLTSEQIEWCIGSNGLCDPAVPVYPGIDQNGEAECGPFVGAVTVLAGTSAAGVSDAPVFTVFGSAQLTCP